MRSLRITRASASTLAMLGVLAASAAPAANDREERTGPPRFVARLTSTQEVPPISSPARGSFNAAVDAEARTIRYELRYEGVESQVVQAHLHTAQPGVNGGIMVWLCGSASLPGPPGTPECPAAPGLIEGELTSDQVVGPAAQGISPGEFDEVVRAIRNGIVYANVHTTQYPAGEIRGQLRRGMTTARAPSTGGTIERGVPGGGPGPGAAAESGAPDAGGRAEERIDQAGRAGQDTDPAPEKGAGRSADLQPEPAAEDAGAGSAAGEVAGEERSAVPSPRTEPAAPRTGVANRMI